MRLNRKTGGRDLPRFADHNHDQISLTPSALNRRVVAGHFEAPPAYLAAHDPDLFVFGARYHWNQLP